MSMKLLHTPEGVRDLYGKECANKLLLEQKMRTVIHSYGYNDIQTPTFEFFDVYSKEIGTTPSRELYKFFDKEGNTLVLRPDFTPSMARCAAKYAMDDSSPIRFSYLGNTFTNTSNLQGKLKEVTQIGAELIGDGSVYADAEMIALIVATLKETGLSDFQISIGNVEYFKGICQDAKLDEETEMELREYISGKNYFGAEELMNEKSIQTTYQKAILDATDVIKNSEELESKKSLVDNKRSSDAIDHLIRLYDVLCKYGIERYVSFDLGMLSKYNYYTGIIVKAYTYGVGDAICKGGRYDSLLSCFGKNAPAVGFAIVIDDLMTALNSQKLLADIEEPTILYYSSDNVDEMIRKAQDMRSKGQSVALVKEAK